MVNLVCAVDRQIRHSLACQRDEGDSALNGQVLGRKRSWDSADPQPRFNHLSEASNRPIGRGSRAKANRHAVPDESRRRLASALLWAYFLTHVQSVTYEVA